MNKPISGRTSFLVIVATFALALLAGAVVAGPSISAGPVWPAPSIAVSATLAAATTDGTYTEVTGSKMRVEQVLSGRIHYVCSSATSSADMKMQGSEDDSTYFDLTALDVAGADQSGARVAIASAATDHFVVDGVGKTAKSAANGTYRWVRMVARRTLDGGAQPTVTCTGFAK